MKKIWLFAVVAALAVSAASCGGGSGGGGTVTGDLKTVTVKSSTSTGDFTPSVVASLGTGGTLKFTIGGVDADGDGVIDTPSLTGLKVSPSAAAMTIKAISGETDVTCDGGSTVGSGDKYDIGISLDTTGSMQGAAVVMANKIADFTTALGTAGVDAMFTGITVGDAFATKLTTGSEFADAVSQGTLGVPPSFDPTPCERPDTGTSLINATDMATFFGAVEGATSFASGCDGGDATENYLGSVQFITQNVTPRDGSTRIIISIGDNCAHTPASAVGALDYGPITAPWLPPDPVSFASGLTGNAVVHVIGNTDEFLGCSTMSPATYVMKGLADATGGQFVDLGGYGTCTTAATCPVDLATLPILGAITGGMNYLCDGLTSFYGAAGDYPFDLTITAGGKTAFTRMVLGLGW